MWTVLVACSVRPEAALLSDPGSKPAPPAPTPELVAAEAVFARCALDCRFDFQALDAERVTVVQSYCHRAEPSCIEFVGELTSAGRVRFAALQTELSARSLKEDYGCGACVDGNDYTVVLTSGRGYHYPPHLARGLPDLEKRADAVFTALHRAALTCASDEFVRFGPDCTPRDKIRPQPYGRP